MKSKFWISLGMVAILAGAVGYLVLRPKVGADTLSSSGTKIQLVDASGDNVARQIPVSLVFNGTVRQCGTTLPGSLFGSRKISTGCKTINKSFNGTVLTDKTGAYQVTTTSYKPLSKDYLKIIAEYTLSEKLNRVATATESADLVKIIDVLNAHQDLYANNQISDSALDKILVLANITNIEEKMNLAFPITSSTFIDALFSGTEQPDLQLTNVVASLKSDTLVSDSQTISLYATDYKPSVNLTVKYANADQLDAIEKLYLADLQKQNAGLTDQTAIQPSAGGFVDYVSYYYIHLFNPYGLLEAQKLGVTLLNTANSKALKLNSAGESMAYTAQTISVNSNCLNYDAKTHLAAASCKVAYSGNTDAWQLVAPIAVKDPTTASSSQATKFKVLKAGLITITITDTDSSGNAITKTAKVRLADASTVTASASPAN